MSGKIMPQSEKEYSIKIDNAFIQLVIAKENISSEQIVELTSHVHSHAEIFTCNKGEITLEFANKTITLYQGDGVIIPPSIPHNRVNRYKEIDTNALGVVCSEISKQHEYNVYSTFKSHINSNDIFVFRNQNGFCAAVNNILKNTTNENKFINIITFVTEFCKLFSSDDSLQKLSEKTDKNIKNIDRLVKLDFLINTKFMTDLNNRQVASELFISERQLARLVREHYGSTLHSLIVNKRIEAAATLLEKTDYSVESILLLVGFKSKTAFYNDFYKIYGYTPTEYRHKIKSTL